MFERLAQDGRNLTLATAAGVGIAFGGAQALRSWQAAQDAASPSPESSDRVQRQNEAIGRLQRLFAEQPAHSAFRNAVQVKPD